MHGLQCMPAWSLNFIEIPKIEEYHAQISCIVLKFGSFEGMRQ